MRPSSLGGGRILRRTLSVCPSVCLSVRPVIVSVTSRHLANYNDTHVLFGTRWGPHIVRPSQPHEFLFMLTFSNWFLSRASLISRKRLAVLHYGVADPTGMFRLTLEWSWIFGLVWSPDWWGIGARSIAFQTAIFTVYANGHHRASNIFWFRLHYRLEKNSYTVKLNSFYTHLPA